MKKSELISTLEELAKWYEGLRSYWEEQLSHHTDKYWKDKPHIIEQWKEDRDRNERKIRALKLAIKLVKEK